MSSRQGAKALRTGRGQDSSHLPCPRPTLDIHGFVKNQKAFQSPICWFFLKCLLPKPARPIKPVPTRSMVAGSGTGAGPLPGMKISRFSKMTSFAQLVDQPIVKAGESSIMAKSGKVKVKDSPGRSCQPEKVACEVGFSDPQSTATG